MDCRLIYESINLKIQFILLNNYKRGVKMFNINMIRIDERLAHGQILLKWLKTANCSRVVVIDDETATDPIMDSVMRLMFPKNIKLNIFTVEEGINAIKSKKLYDNVFLLIKSLHVAKTLYDNGILYKEISLGSISTGPRKKKIIYNLFLSQDEINIIEYFINKKVEVIMQAVPDSEPIYVDNINKIINDTLE